MLSLVDLNPKGYELNGLQIKNLIEHCERINVFQRIFGNDMVVCSGVRSVEDQKRIYHKINIKRINNGLEPVGVPFGSAHLLGAATDFEDRMRYIYDFCQLNASLLEQIGIWVENISYTRGWCHLQTVPSRSGARFFIPY